MNTLKYMDPWNFLDDLLDTGSRTFRSMRARAAGRFPPVNVYLDENAVMIEIELPGKTAKDVDLSLEPQAVVISDKPEEKAGEEGPQTGNATPAWSRRLELPFRVDAEKANARFTNGILRIELPKSESAYVRKIAIQ